MDAETKISEGQRKDKVQKEAFAVEYLPPVSLTSEAFDLQNPQLHILKQKESAQGNDVIGIFLSEGEDTKHVGYAVVNISPDEPETGVMSINYCKTVPFKDGLEKSKDIPESVRGLTENGSTLNALEIDEKYQQKGLGAKFLTAALVTFKEQGLKRIRIVGDVTIGQKEPLDTFYTHLGAQTDETGKMEFNLEKFTTQNSVNIAELFEEKANQQEPAHYKSELEFDEQGGVEADRANFIKMFREDMRKTFDVIPEYNIGDDLQEYVDNNPGTVMIIDPKDAMMFPLLINEVGDFLKEKTKIRKLDKKIKSAKTHEFDHVQKMFDVGSAPEYLGFFMVKHKGEPQITPFVHPENPGLISLRDKLRINLAPRVEGIGNIKDYFDSFSLVDGALRDAQGNDSQRLRIYNDVLFAVSERFFPKKLHEFVKKTIERSNEKLAMKEQED